MNLQPARLGRIVDVSVYPHIPPADVLTLSQAILSVGISGACHLQSRLWQSM